MSAPTTMPAPRKPVTEAAIWQAIAYATHHDMPAPESITLFPQGTHRPHLALGVRSIEDAERWVEWLDLEGMHSIVFPRKDDDHPGFTSWRGMWGGWSWNIRAYHPDAEPENGPSDDTPSVTAAGQIHWECQQLSDTPAYHKGLPPLPENDEGRPVCQGFGEYACADHLPGWHVAAGNERVFEVWPATPAVTR